jgi:hypothetical protein
VRFEKFELNNPKDDMANSPGMTRDAVRPSKGRCWAGSRSEVRSRQEGREQSRGQVGDEIGQQ